MGQDWRNKIEDIKNKIWISIATYLKINKDEKDNSSILIRKNIDRHLKYMEEHNIEIISIEDKEYPWCLKNIPNPPICIYIIGNKNILNEASIAIVGCRDATEYGKITAKSFAFNLSNRLCPNGDFGVS